MPIAKKASTKKKVADKPTPEQAKAALTKHKTALKKADEGIPIKPMWSKKRIQAIVDGLMTAHYFMHSSAVKSYIKAQPWSVKPMERATKALADARKVFYQALEAYMTDEDNCWEEDEENDWDDEDEEDDE